MPRSPVWLRKIPSTVSGSQGSRRGLSPAVRFAFPLGARLNITLRARPCQELFSESFCRPSRGPRGASRLPGLCPSRRRVRYYTLPRRGAGGKPSRTQDAHNSGAVKRRGTEGIPGREGGIGLAFRPGPDAGPPRGPGASPRSIYGTTPEARRLRASALRGGRLGRLYTRRHWREEPGPAFGPGSSLPAKRRRFRALAQPARGAARFPSSGTPPKKKDGRLRSPPALRAGRPSATVPGRFSLYLYIDMFSSGCRKCAWSSSRNAATRPWERPSLQACSRSSP